MRLAYTEAPKVGSLISRRTLDGDARYYQRIGATGLLATRIRGFKSMGDFPDFQYFGGNSELRGYDYLQFAGQNVVFANAELRFPLIEAMLTPIGILGGIRGVLFFNIGAGWWDNTGFKFWTNKTEEYSPIVGYDVDPVTGYPVLVYGDPVAVSGFRLVGGRASYGIGLETFALGFPIHFDWSWRTLFDKNWENLLFGSQVAADAWRKGRFQFWIGYDF
jgi:outer membrane protein assembly factor BamA